MRASPADGETVDAFVACSHDCSSFFLQRRDRGLRPLSHARGIRRREERSMAISRHQSENKIVDLREQIKRTLDRTEQSLLRRELMVEIAMLHELGGDDRH